MEINYAENKSLSKLQFHPWLPSVIPPYRPACPAILQPWSNSINPCMSSLLNNSLLEITGDFGPVRLKVAPSKFQLPQFAAATFHEPLVTPHPDEQAYSVMNTTYNTNIIYSAFLPVNHHFLHFFAPILL